MAKFKVGDRVVSVKSGRKGVIVAPGPGGTYAVAFDDGREMHPVNVEDYNLRTANSRACNAKFKVGDRVTWQHHNGSYSNEVIDYIVPPNGYAFRDGGIGAESEIRAGWVPESQTGRANMPPLNSRACNGVRSRNASAKIVTTGNFGTLKVGDRVDFRKSRYWRGTGVVTKVYGDGIIDVKGDNGEGEMEIHEEDIMNSRVRSANAVVQKALNACARNGGIDDFKVGDRVMVRSVVGFTPTDPKPGTVTAIYKSDNRIAVKKDDGGRGLFDASMVTKNACGTASNATDADVARYLSAAKDRIRGEVSTLKDVVGLLKMKPMPPSAKKAHEKIVKAMASLQRALAELS